MKMDKSGVFTTDLSLKVSPANLERNFSSPCNGVPPIPQVKYLKHPCMLNPGA